MSHYFFDRQEFLQKVKDRYYNNGNKEKAAEYYIANKEDFRENVKIKYRNLSEEEKEVKREYGINRCISIIEDKKQTKKRQGDYQASKKQRQKNTFKKMSKKILKFDDVEVNKKEVHASKQQIALDLEDIDKILVFDKFKHNDKGFQYFAGYENDNIIRSLCIIFSQTSRYIKHFDNDGKNMSFKIEGDNVFVKYIGMTNRIKEKLGIKFLSDPVFD